MFGNLYKELPGILGSNKNVAIATVVETSGSTPQKPGSTAIIGTSGIVYGTVGGGIVEHQVVELASAGFSKGKSEYLEFRLNDDISDEDSVICGGGMKILIDANPSRHLAVFEAIKKSHGERTFGILLSVVTRAKKKVTIKRTWFTQSTYKGMASKLPEKVAVMTAELFKNQNRSTSKSFTIESPANQEVQHYFLESIAPLPHLVITGAGHVGKALSHLGKLLDFETTVWDDRKDLANPENLPDADNILTCSIDELAEEIMPDNNTYLVIVTRGHKQDTEILKRFINSDACYIGMIGSRKKILQVRQLSLEEGWAGELLWNRIHAPVGLHINSVSVQEIAVSIAAQLIQVRNG